MRRGGWHQCGDRSQKMVQEQLEHAAGVGVIISPRDLAMRLAADYAQAYHELGADVLIDLQFYEPSFSHPKLASYPINEYRTSISQLRQIKEDQLTGLARSIDEINREIAADAVIAPALVYQAGRPDIVEVNACLFGLAKQVGESIGVPTYATVVVERSSTASLDTIKDLLSHATALDADGWYFAFEFEPERVPSDREAVYRCCLAGLMLACTGKPLLHAYAGFLSLLSFGFGATGAAIGHSQNLWSFTRARWQPTTGQGGGGDAPPRFFSSSLWGTIVYPDETAQLPPALRDRVISLSPFSTAVGAGLPWTRWNANKHLIYELITTASAIGATKNARANAQAAMDRLGDAANMHHEIEQVGIQLGDETNVYQTSWRSALRDLLTKSPDDFDYLELLS